MTWCDTDEHYEHADAMEFRAKLWASFKDGRPGGATIGTLFWAVKQAGGEAVVQEIQAEIRAAKAGSIYLT